MSRRSTGELALAALAYAVVGWLVWDAQASRTWFFADDWSYLHRIVAEDYALRLGELLPWATGRHRALDRTLKTILFTRFGFAASANHRVQLALHVATATLLFALTRRLVASRAAAWIAAAVFLLNPFTLHTVSWFSLLHDNLTACFAVVVLLCWTRSWEPGRRGWVWFAVAAVAFALGLKAKESLVVVPVLLVLFDAFFRPPAAGEWRVQAGRIGVLVAIAAVFFLAAPRFPTLSVDEPYFQSFRPAVVARSYWWYLGQIVFLPAPAVTWLATSSPTAAVAGIALVLAAPLATLANGGRAARLLVFGWTALWLGLLPTAVLPNHYTYPYYVYTPMVGGALAAAGAVALAAGAVSRPAARAAIVAAAWTLVALWYGETRALPDAPWYVGVADESRRVLASLRAAQPMVPAGTRLVLVGVADLAPFKFVTWYDDGPSHVVGAWYRDPTLRATLAGSEREADAGAHVLVWRDGGFAVAPVTPPGPPPA